MTAPAKDRSAPGRNWRWSLVALLFFATTINYLDRIVLAVLIPVIRKDLGFSDREYGLITGAFQIAYTIGFLAAGKIIDVLGTRIGYAAAMLWWSISALLHVVSRGTWSLGFWRGMLGFGEAGNYPAAVKAVAEWYPEKKRSTVVGVFNSGTTLAAVAGPPLLVALTAAYGWRASFALTAATGLVWLLLWVGVYRQAPQIIQRASPGVVTWREALQDRRTSGIVALKFLTDGVWWFYLFWLPPYLFDVRKLNLNEIGWALPVIYLMAGAGSVAGGWLAGFWMRRGRPVADARCRVMAIVAVLMPIAALAVFTSNTVLAIALISLATAVHQGWTSNLFTIPSDIFPKETVASVVGIGGCAGGLGGFLFSAILPGYMVTYFGYVPMFVLAGVLHPIAWIVGTRLLWTEPPRASVSSAAAPVSPSI